MEAINYLLRFFFEALTTLFILRFWLQAARADFYNPLSQFVVKLTNPFVVPLRRVIPGLGGYDLATLLLAVLVSTLQFIVIPMLNGGPFEPGLASYLGLISLIKQAGFLLFIIMLVMAIMSWVVQGYNPTMMVFQQLTEPFLRPIRKITPDLGGIDISIIIAFLALNVINILLGSSVPYWAIL